MQTIQVASGTVIGRDHRIKGENGQDALVLFDSERSIVGVVADGCGSGKWSEVGARFGAHSTAMLIQQNLGYFEAASSESELRDILDYIESSLVERLLGAITSMGGRKSILVSEYFLFTVVAVVVTQSWLTIISFGDGAYGCNGEVKSLGPFPDNAPPYLAYKISGSSLEHCRPELLSFSICARLPLAEVSSCFIGTDGVMDLENAATHHMPGKEEELGSVSQFWLEDRYFNNPDMLRRRLFLANKDSYRAVPVGTGKARLVHDPGLLPDDTTLIVLRSNLSSLVDREESHG